MRIVADIAELSRLGGIEVTLLDDVGELVRRGHEVHVFHGPHHFGAGDLRADLAAAGVVLHGPHRLLWDPVRTPLDVAAYVASARVMARLAPDVVWLQRFEHAAWASVATKAGRIPVVCHLHHAPMYRRSVQGILARRVRQFLAVSAFTRGQWVAAGLDPAVVDVLHNAVRPEDYPAGGTAEARAARVALGLPLDVPIALFYGRFTREKGIEVLLDAWTALGREDAHLLLAGAVPPGTGHAVAQRIDVLAASGRATVLPPRRDVVPLLHAADVVVFPSLEAESFGRVALEALMTGRPVVASRLGGTTEVVPADLDELLVPPGDVAAVAAAMERLLDWRATDPRLGERCAGAVGHLFRPDERIDRLEEVLAARAHARGPRR